MTAGTGGLLAGMGPLDEHVSRLPTTTPINTNPVSPDSSLYSDPLGRSKRWVERWVG